jgi:ABC-type multidrug transport system ATPase subunit
MTIAYFLGGMPNNGGQFIYFQFNLLFTNLASFYIAQILASVTDSAARAFALFPLVFIFLNRFSGFGLAVGDVPKFWIWAPYLVYSRWTFEGLMINLYEPFGDDGQTVLSQFDFDGGDKNDSIWILIAWTGFLCSMVYFAMKLPKIRLLKVQNASSVSPVKLKQGTAGASGTLKTSLIPNGGGSAGATRRVSSKPGGIAKTVSIQDTLIRTMSSVITDDTDLLMRKKDKEGGELAEHHQSDYLPGKSQMTVDWYRQTTANISASRGCKLVFRNIYYAVPDDKASLTMGQRIANLFPRLKKKSSNLPSPGRPGTETGLSMSPIGQQKVQKRTPPPGHRDILKGVSGRAHPGEMFALMGASGAGKSTLLDVLASRKNSGVVSGAVMYDGVEQFSLVSELQPSVEQTRAAIRARASTAYVTQDNVHIGELTVRQNLRYAALLRLDASRYNDQKVNERVNKILDMLGLTEHADTVTGNAYIRGISGGQLKRLSIAVEIVNLPELIFLDEPTTGLDSTISYEVMNAVRNMANQNRTVIATIHQPSPDTFSLFDKLMVLADGRVIYFGPCSDVVKFFTHSPYAFPYDGGNHADYVVAVAGGFIKSKDGEVVDAQKLHSNYEDSKLAKSFNQNIDHMIETDKALQEQRESERGEPRYYGDRPSSLGFANPPSRQLYVLLHRVGTRLFMGRRMVIAGLIRNIIVGVFFGSIYYNLSTDAEDPTSYSNRLALMFFCLIFGMVQQQEQIPIIFSSRLLYYRERGAKAYSAVPYFISTWAYVLTIVAVYEAFFCMVIYQMTGLTTHQGQTNFTRFYFTILLFCYACIFFFQFVSHVNKSQQAAVGISPLGIFFNVLFAGFIIFIPNLQSWLVWGPYISFYRYAFQSLVLNELKDNPDLTASSIYLDQLGFDSLSSPDCIWILLLFTFGTCFMAGFAVKYIDHEQR